MMDQTEDHAKIDGNDECGEACSQTQNDEQRADCIGNQRVDQAPMGTDVDWIGKMAGHLREVRDFFQAVFQEKTGSQNNAQ